MAKSTWLLLPAENILLDRLAHQVGPEGAESERTPLSPQQKNLFDDQRFPRLIEIF